ncbi:DNA polymerase III subunit beta [Streptomyces sp. NPDC088923]|uniref:DNA polymerase III subunit beta n=1 Tax=Streptomyces sp. NPDC088923 TaxID=3365913 RepID=UPI00380004BD
MEFRIERRVFAEAVGWAVRGAATRPVVPVLGGVLVEAGDEGRVRVTGFDHEVCARAEADAGVGAAGRVVVPGARLLDVCRVLPDAPVECGIEDGRLVVRCGGARFGLAVLPAGEYPALPAPAPALGTVGAREWAAAVGQVASAAARDVTVPVLTALQLDFDGESLTLAATDRYRYAQRTLPWEAAGRGAGTITVPARRLGELCRVLAKHAGQGPVRLGHGDTFSLATADGAFAASLRPLAGRLPAARKLFALGAPARAVLARAPLEEALRRVAVVAEPGNPVALSFEPGGSVLLGAGTEADDTASQRLDAETVPAEPMTVAFNAAYLLDALTALQDHARIHLALQGPGGRAVVSGSEEPRDAREAQGSEGARYAHRHLLMALRDA